MIAPVLVLDGTRLEQLIERQARIVDGESGFWRVEIGDQELFVIADESHDRLRIMAPVAEDSALDEHELRTLLSANFDRAIDARYALGDGYLWSVFVHPLHDLSDELFCDGLRQVCRLADTFGTSYSSTDLIFGAGE